MFAREYRQQAVRKRDPTPAVEAARFRKRLQLRAAAQRVTQGWRAVVALAQQCGQLERIAQAQVESLSRHGMQRLRRIAQRDRTRSDTRKGHFQRERKTAAVSPRPRTPPPAVPK